MPLAQGYYVYEHWRPDTDLCFYVGAGKGLRAGNMKARNRRHLAVQAELADLGICVEVRLVQGRLTKEEADKLEAERIAFWKEAGIPLCNMIDGATHKGVKRTPEQNAARSQAMMGNTRGKGVPKSETWKAKMSK